MRASRSIGFVVGLSLLAACEPAQVPAPPISYAGGGADGSSGSGGGLLDDDIYEPPPLGTASTEGPFPRLSAFVGQLERYSAAEKDTIARFELVSLRAGPEEVTELTGRNPDIRLYYRVMPQTVPERDWGRAWSWMDRVRRYATANDWTLRLHDGSEATIRGWGDYWRWLDFTSHCPQGHAFDPDEPDLDSRGLTLAEWMGTRFIPWFVANRMAAYEGLWWEVVADEPSISWFWFDVSNPDGARLDWNRNGISDWAEGGYDEFYRFLDDWKQTTTTWLTDVRARIGMDYPIIAGGDVHAPPLERFHGFKNEDFLNRNRFTGAMWEWWDEFYTHTDVRPRRGYAYQRDHARASWNLSVNQIFWYDNENWQFSDGEKMRRYVRFALGTTLLGDGLFCFYDLENPNPEGQPRNPWVSDYYDLNLGSHAYPVRRHVFGADTVYTRHFHDGTGHVTGFVGVNPNTLPFAGIGPEDAVIRTY